MWGASLRPAGLVGLLVLLGSALPVGGSDGWAGSMGGLTPLEEPTPLSARVALGEAMHTRNGFHGAQAAGGGFAIRADGGPRRALEVGADTPFLYYDVALKSDQGVALGYSVGAQDGLLVLGWQGQGLVSEDGELGPFFYTRGAGALDPDVPGMQKPYSAVSSDLACLYNALFISCYYHNVNRGSSGVSPNITNLWADTPTPSVPACAGGCQIAAVALWRRAAAIVFRRTSDNSQIAATFFLRLSPVLAWECTSGCNSTGASTATLGGVSGGGRAYASVSMWENVVVLGSPTLGEVEVWVGARDPARQGPANLQPTAVELLNAPYDLHKRWTLVETLSGNSLGGLNLFGAAVSLQAKFLVVGAPGTSQSSGAISVHRVVRGDAGATVEQVCVVQRGGGTEFGFAADQDEEDGEDFIVVGAPRENAGYIVRVDPVRGCEVPHRLIHSTSSSTPQDRVGAAVAIDGGFVWLGAPDYFRQTPSGPINGLLYVFTYCSSWSKLTETLLPPFQGYTVYLTECSRCPAEMWAPGARTGSCSSCFPDNVGVKYGGCNFTCLEGYFGPRCEPCSTYAPDALALAKPGNSSWADGRAECTWRCDAMFEPAPRGAAECVPCSAGTAEEEAAKVYVPGLCEWACAPGFFNASSGPRPRCVVCSEIMAQLGVPKPGNTSWFDGGAECVWVADPGYSCSREAGECEACPPKPADAVWAPVASEPLLAQCGYACAEGFYGHPLPVAGVCVTCSALFSEVLPPQMRPPLPAEAFWDDAAGYCGSTAWACGEGYAKSAGGTRCCPAEPPPNAVFYRGGEPCPFMCAGGYSLTADGTACEPCANMPNGSEWLEGSGACVWVPVQGFQCTAGACAPCPPKPAHSSWSAAPLTTATMARCGFVCDAGFYGHPQWAPGVCVTCSALFTEVLLPEQRPPLPADGVWLDDAGTCGADSWGCAEGFVRSLDPEHRVCCPPGIPNSYVDETSLVCGVRCELGYSWKQGEAVCEPCPAKPANSEWAGPEGSCAWECTPNFPFGRERGVCLSCPDYMALLGTALPQGAAWPSDSGVSTCTATSWTCKGSSFKALDADPPGCCPQGAEHATTGGPAATCGYTCATGYSWDKAARACKYCDDAGPVAPPAAHAFWNGTRCAHQCYEPFWPDPEFPGKPTRCLSCAERARWLEWPLPANAEWSAGISSWEQCTPESAWRCPDWGTEGYVRNGPRGSLCCSKADVVVPIDAAWLDGGWAEGQCAWECRPGLFPRVPEFKAWNVRNISCMECGRYLAYHGVSLCPWSQCADREYVTKASACFAEVTGSLLLDGIPQSNLEPAHAAAIRRSVAEQTGAAEADIKITYISTRDRRAHHAAGAVQALAAGGERGAGASAAHLTSGKGLQAGGGGGAAHLNALGIGMTMTVGGVDPAAVAGVKATLLTHVIANGLTQALRRDNLSGTVRLASGGFTIGAASEAWQCKSPRRLNPATGVCCPLGTPGPDLEIPTERVMWALDGCNIQQCNKGFHLFGGSCLTCAELNPRLPEPRFLPADAEWVEGETTCGSWQCKQGFVPSVSGYSCVSLSILRASCSKHSRCGTCLGEEHCVWCPGNQGVPGISAEGACTPGLEMRPTSEYGCPYGLDGKPSAACLCEANRCKRECQHSACDACAGDVLCGWCGSQEKCMQGGLLAPKYEVCAADWIPSGGCSTDWGVWIIGLVCAGVSSSLVAIMCCYICVRLQRASEMASQGRQAPSADDIQRLLRSLHAFTYKSPAFDSAAQGPAAVASPGGTAQEEDEERCCCICLGGYSDGDELRMLPCFHVYHAPCVDQWLSVSLECPLCKTSVSGQQGHANRLVRAERCFLAGGNPHEQMHTAGAAEPSPERSPSAGGWGAFGSLFSTTNGNGNGETEEVRRMGWGRMTRGRRHAPLRAEHQRRQQESERVAAGGDERAVQLPGAFSAGVALEVLPPSMEPAMTVAPPAFQLHQQPPPPPNPQMYALASASSFGRARSGGSQRSQLSSGASSPSSGASSTLVYSHIPPPIGGVGGSSMPPPLPAHPSNPSNPPGPHSRLPPITPSPVRPFDDGSEGVDPPPYSHESSAAPYEPPPPYPLSNSTIISLPPPRVTPPPSGGGGSSSSNSMPVPADYHPPQLPSTEAGRPIFIPPGHSMDPSDYAPHVNVDSRSILGPVQLDSPGDSPTASANRAPRSGQKHKTKTPKARAERAPAHLELSPGAPTHDVGGVSVYVDRSPATAGPPGPPPRRPERRPAPPHAPSARPASPSGSRDGSDSRVVGL